MVRFLYDTVAFGVTGSNIVMDQIHNSKKRMPAILTDELAWEWLMEKSAEERLLQIARTQIPSRLWNFCTIDRNYRTTLEATPLAYPELAPIDMSFIDTEQLAFDHWPANLEPAVLVERKHDTIVEETANRSETKIQADLFS